MPPHPIAVHPSRIALNPIQWMASPDGWLDPGLAPRPEEILQLVHEAGFGSVMAAVPPSWSSGEYADRVEKAGLQLAPGYFVCRFDGVEETSTAILETAQQVAREHAALGLRDIGLGLGMSLEAPRVRHPAVGHAASDERLTAIVDLIRRISATMRAEGVRPALHPHVGTWIETEEESRRILDATTPTELGFLPDTGHLAWADVDTAGLIRDFGERIPFVHVKDCRTSVADAARTNDWDYRRTVREGLWVEPGRGELNLTAILEALPAEFDGWLMVEVDSPDIDDPFQSAVASASWMAQFTQAPAAS